MTRPRIIAAVAILAALSGTSQVTAGESTCAVSDPFQQYCNGPGAGGESCDDPNNVRCDLKWSILYLARGCADAPATATCAELMATAYQKAAPTLLAFDHVRERWRSLHPGRGELKKDINGHPHVRVGRKDTVVAIIENTNPLLFAVTLGESKEEDIEVIESLDKLASLLGGVAAAVTRQKAARAGVLMVAIDAAPVDEWDRLGTALQSVQAIVRTLAVGNDKAIALVQAAESRRAATTCDQLSAPATEKVAASFDTLRTARTEAMLPCPEGLEAYTAYVALLDADLTKPTLTAAARDKLGAILDANECTNGLTVGTSRTIKASYDDVLGCGDDIARCIANERKHRFVAFKALHLATLRNQLLTDSAAVLAQSGAALLNAAQLEQFVSRCRASTFGPSVGSWIIAEREAYPVGWDKTQTHTMKLIADSPFSKQVSTARRTDLTPSYRVSSTIGSMFDVGFSLTYTPLESPEFSAVTNPDDHEKKVIGQTKAETRAGNIALLLTYRFAQHFSEDSRDWPVQPAIDIGAGLDTDKSAFFTGLSLGFTRYIRLGGGLTWQQVNQLDGQTVGDAIGSSDDVRTKDAFKRDLYASLTISLGSLSFFGGAD